MVYQIMENASLCELKDAGLDGYYTLHGHGLFYSDPNGYNWTSDYISGMGDPITDLTSNIAAEQRAKQTYEYLMDLACNDESVLAPLRFLRAREIVHYQRFGEANREDCSKNSRVLKAHKYSIFGNLLSIRKMQDVGISRPICC